MHHVSAWGLKSNRLSFSFLSLNAVLTIPIHLLLGKSDFNGLFKRYFIDSHSNVQLLILILNYISALYKGLCFKKENDTLPKNIRTIIFLFDLPIYYCTIKTIYSKRKNRSKA